MHRFTEVNLSFLDQMTVSMGPVFNTIEATMRTEGLLDQSHEKLGEHLQEHTEPYLVLSSWGCPSAAQSLSQLIVAPCKGLGFPGYSPNGLRHLAGSALAEAGCSVHEIMSVLGHRTEAQAIEYVKQTNRKMMAASAVTKWEVSGTSTD